MSADRRMMLFLRVLEMKSYRPISIKISPITIAKAIECDLVRKREGSDEPFVFTEFILTPRGKRTLTIIEKIYRDRPHHDFRIVKRLLAGEDYPDWLIPQ